MIELKQTLYRSRVWAQTTSLVLLFMLLGCADSDKSDTVATDPSSSSLVWEQCSDNEMVQCAILDVPKDYAQREGETIELALRRKAANSETRKGILMVHLGGQSAARDVDDIVFDSATPDIIFEEFDLIGFDTRGSGMSAPIDCEEFLTEEVNYYPTTDSLIQMLVDNRNLVATSCFEKYGSELQNTGTKVLVEDMEEIRQALGEEKLNYFGVSFGTRLGALYLQTYPEKSGAFVLDASMPPTSSNRELIVSQLSQSQANLEILFDGCTQIDPECDSAELLAAAELRINNLVLEGAAREFDLFYSVLSATVEFLDDGEITLGPLVDYLQERNADTLEEPFGELVDEYIEPISFAAVEVAIICADDAARPDTATLVSDLDEFNQISDIFAEFKIADLAALCVGWPEALSPLATIASDTAPQALVIGGLTDPFTPVQSARDMASAIGAHYIESDHSGHGIVYLGDSECIDTVATEFLRTGDAPSITACSEQ